MAVGGGDVHQKPDYDVSIIGKIPYFAGTILELEQARRSLTFIASIIYALISMIQ
jgi:hypothetical protein